MRWLLYSDAFLEPLSAPLYCDDDTAIGFQPAKVWVITLTSFGSFRHEELRQVAPFCGLANMFDPSRLTIRARNRRPIRVDCDLDRRVSELLLHVDD
jgi:hypothetical protein